MVPVISRHHMESQTEYICSHEQNIYVCTLCGWVCECVCVEGAAEFMLCHLYVI